MRRDRSTHCSLHKGKTERIHDQKMENQADDQLSNKLITAEVSIHARNQTNYDSSTTVSRRTELSYLDVVTRPIMRAAVEGTADLEADAKDLAWDAVGCRPMYVDDQQVLVKGRE